jgi:hypothetical protein
MKAEGRRLKDEVRMDRLGSGHSSLILHLSSFERVA